MTPLHGPRRIPSTRPRTKTRSISWWTLRTRYQLADGNLSWSPRYKAFTQLNAQITRNFRHWAIYLGGENLTNFRQKNPIVGASDPWGNDFDATMIYGPLHGAMVYVGFRYNFTKYL